ncbi:hypothetical protein B9Z55_026007 [Caenorhabditis nigoni]|uniref:Uncharacterized protein n=1 Tax=Caenorhabditis nigoni TaxID=1611254 RepID=A0A2G5T1P3_9PELO|nr:hypothetical protein B9Z55_026007 [Caenorhabditis nigoni]
MVQNSLKFLKSLEEDPMKVDHVEVEIMDGSAYFQRPESRIVEDFEYPSQEINVENPDYHDNSDHEEEQTLTRNTLEPKFPIFESSAKDKNKSKAFTQLLDDYGSSDGEDEQKPMETSPHFFFGKAHMF